MGQAPDGGNVEHLPEIDWRDRMRALDEAYEFYPTTKSELTDAFVAIPFLDTTGSTGAHLNEVLLHQKKHDVVEPHRAVRSKTNAFGSYMRDADMRNTSLLGLYEQLDDMNPELEVSEVVHELGLTGVLSTVQYVHIEKAVQTGNDTALKGGVKRPRGSTEKRLVTGYDPETHDSITLEMLMGGMLDEKIVTLKSLVMNAGMSHASRQVFWEKVIAGSRSHVVARPTADKIIIG